MNLDKAKIIGLCIDGVSVMIGKKDGLSVKLKQLNKGLIVIYCVCYWLVLVCIDINFNFKCVGNVEIYMLQFWKLFYYFLKKMVCFLKYFEGYRSFVFNLLERQKCVKILKRVCKIRWLSFEVLVVVVMEDLIFLV